MTITFTDVVVGPPHETRLRVAALTLRAGITVVVGDNGAGKSTLLDVAAGVLRPERGRVDLNDTPLLSLSPRDRARGIASLGQQPLLVAGLIGEARIAQGLVPRRGPGAALDDVSRAGVHAVAVELGVQSLLARPLGSMSGGQRQRLHVARALVDDQATAIILDEPFAGLDDSAVALVVAALRARRDKIVVLSVHDLGVAMALRGRMLGVRAGEIVVDADVAALAGSGESENADRIFVDPVRVVVDGDFVGVLRRRVV